MVRIRKGRMRRKILESTTVYKVGKGRKSREDRNVRKGIRKGGGKKGRKDEMKE